jgi:zinc/manganese transport system ATP-binding protein
MSTLLQATPAAGAPAITLLDLSLAYRDRLAVQGLSGRIEAGSLTAVVGPNGGGKSSLLSALAGQMPPLRGQVQWAPGLRARLAWLPQQAQIDRSFPIRVVDVVMMGGWARHGAWRSASRSCREQALQALRTVGLAGLEGRGVAELSTGQFQRVLFARLLIQDAPLILLDEPFAGVDAATTADLLALVQQWHAEGRTVLAVLHDLDAVRRHFPHTLLLAREAVAWGDTDRVLTPPQLLRARSLSEGWDGRSPWASPLLAAA